MIGFSRPTRGLSLSVAPEVERFGIKVTLIEPGFFRTDLLDERNVKWPSKVIEDYVADGKPKDVWSPTMAHSKATPRSWAKRWSRSPA